MIPLEVLQQEGKLCNKQIRVVVGLWRVRISLAVQVYAKTSIGGPDRLSVYMKHHIPGL